MNCLDDAVGQVSETGSVLEMLSGRIYEVEELGQVHTSLWRSPQRVWICAQRSGRYQIFNASAPANGQVYALRVK
jgi:hypothetical protein